MFVADRTEQLRNLKRVDFKSPCRAAGSSS
jgi:hypothetical protein